MPIYNVQAPDGKVYKVDAPENATQKDIFGFVKQQIEAQDVKRLQKEYGPGVMETFGRGVKRGIGELGSTFTDIIPAMGASALGFDEYAKEQLAEAAAKRKEREAAAPPVFGSYKDVEGIGDVPKFLAETIGEQVPNIATSLIPGVGAGVAASRAGLTAAGKAAAVGAGTYLGSYAQNAPEVFQNIYQETGQLAPGASAIFGAASAALDSVLPAKLLKNISGPVKVGIVEKILEKSGMDKGLLRSTTAGVLTGIPTEGLTEGAQEAISIAAEKFVADNPQVFGSKEWDRIMESAVKGAVGGGAFGGVGGAIERGRAAAQRRAEYADALERRGQRQLAAEVRRQSAEIDAAQAQELQMQLPGFEAGPATSLYTPEPEPPAPKELKGKQAELFTAEGALTPAVEKAATKDEKAEANRQRQEAQRQATELKEAQAALKKAISELTDVPTDLLSLAKQPSPLTQTIGQARSEMDALAAKRAPKPVEQPAVQPTVPPVAPAVTLSPEGTITEPTILKAPEPITPQTAPTVINDDLLKGLGIGHTALIRKNKLLDGKDITNPEDAAEVKRILEAYVENRSQPIREKVEAYLARPEFQGAADVTTPVEQPAGGSTGVVSEPSTGVATTTAATTEPGGMVSTGTATEQLATGEGQQPVAVTEPVVEEETPSGIETPEAVQTETQGQEAPAQPVTLGKKAKSDLAKAEKGAEAATQEQAKFIEDVDANIDALLTSRLRDEARAAGVKDKDLPSENYRGTDVHNFLRLPALFAQHRDSVDALKESQGTPQQAKNEQQIRQIEEAIAASGPDALAMFQNLQRMPIAQQISSISQLNKLGLQEFDKQAKQTVAKVKADIESGRTEGTAKKEITDEELESFLEDFNQRFINETGKRFFLPAYQGPALDQAQVQLVQRGDVNGLLRNLLDGIKNPVIKQILRRIRSLNLKTKIVIGAVEGGKAGSYDPATDTITLDPTNGLNAHTFLHEVVHAAISNVLASPNHPLTKQFTQFFIQIKDRLGAAYGAQNLQEFAAELVSNPEFQAILKTIKAPRSGNMFQRIMQSIAEFFGFGKSALDAGAQFIGSAVDISGDVQANAAQKMFYGMGNFAAVGQIGQSMPNLIGQTINQAKNTFSNLKDVGVVQAGLGMLRLDNLNTLYKKELPSLQKLIDALERRNGAQEQRIKDANDKYRKFVDIQKKHPQAVERMGDMAIDARLAEIDLLDPNFRPTTANQAEYSRLGQIYRSLPADVQGMYRTMRTDYDASLAQYKALLMKSVSPSLAQRLANEFQNLRGVTGYVPFLRHGDFWVEYEDPQTGERAASAFESVRERQQFIDTVLVPQKLWHKPYQNLQSIAYSAQGIPATSFIGKVMNDLQKQGASQQQLDSVYQSYLTLFPGESILKQFMKAKNVRGMERDMVRNYGDIMVRWARKLANSEYTPQIDRALSEIAVQGEGAPDIQVQEAAKTVLRQSDFFHNPNYSTLVQSATALSYFEYIAGNISSAIVNLTSLPMLVWPILSGKFGFAEASSAMMNASRVAINGMEKNPRYKNLYNRMMEHGQLQHTMAREILEGRRQTTAQYNSLYAKMMNGLSIPFAATERYNRATTAIAAYDLAKSKGMNEDAAIKYAIDTTKDAHTSGLAATAPRWMQHPLGRVFFTFKSFVWNSAFVVARAFHQAYKGETQDVRRAAQRQLIGMYGMATIFAGVKGMPFYGAASTLATMLNALFGDDEPFDFDEEMRRFFGELLYKGVLNYATNLEIANRAGIATDLIFRDDPRGIAEHGYVLSAMQQAFGPLGSYAVNVERGIKAMNEGHVERGVEALLPSWARNGLKGARYMVEGAVTMKGDPITEDVSAYNALMQVIGFAPADLSTTYEKLQAAKGYEREVNAKRTQLLNRYDMAQHAGDEDMKQETRGMIQDFNERFPKKRITSDTLQRSMAARKAAEKQMIHGVRFDKKLMPEIREKFFSDEED